MGRSKTPQASGMVSDKVKKKRPSLSPEASEKRCIALAYDLVEERLMNGTATSQETVHFLKLGSMRERKEQEIMELQKELMKAKTKAYQSTEELQALYKDAIAAFTEYTGEGDEE